MPDHRPEIRDHWLSIELRHLAALEALARERSFRGAADELGYVQSAISQQLFALERVTGARLVDRERGHKQVSLTPAGEVLLAHVEAILDRLHVAKADLEALDEGRCGRLRVAVHRDVAPGIIPSVARAVARQWPGIDLEVAESASDAELLRSLSDDASDAVIATSPVWAPQFDVDELLRDRFVLLVDPASPMAERAELDSLDDLAGLQLITGAACSELTELQARLVERHVRPGVAIRTESARTAVALAARGMGAAIVPRLAVEPAPSDLIVVELGDLLGTRTVTLLSQMPRDGKAALQRFRVLARIVGSDLQRQLKPPLARVS